MQTTMRSTTNKVSIQARRHPFAGAVLTTQHARELTPTLVLLTVQALSEKVLVESSLSLTPQPPPNVADSPRSAFSSSSGDAFYRPNNKHKVQYTVWIAQAWHVLKWAEPSSSLFWEMCTMFHTLFLAEKSMTAQEPTQHNNKYLHPRQANHKLYFPPLLAVEASLSMDSQDGKREKTVSGRTTPDSPISSCGASSPVSRVKMTPNTHLQPQTSSQLPAGTAKELPIWMIGMFLLLHCEDQVFFRCVSGDHNHSLPTLMTSALTSDFWTMNSALSPRTRMHAGHFTDSTRCAGFLLRHLRKFLLLSAVPHNAEAVAALMKLSIASSGRDSEFLVPRSTSSRSVDMNIHTSATSHSHPGDITRQNHNVSSTPHVVQSRTPLTIYSSPSKTLSTQLQHPHDVQAIQNQHQEEHADIGLNIRLSKDDLERLSLILEAPSGGYMDDDPLQIADIIPPAVLSDLASNGGILLEDIEREIKRHLVAELVHNDEGPKDLDLSQIINDIQTLSLSESNTQNATVYSSGVTSSLQDETRTETVDSRIARQPKSLRIFNCHHTTILRKPQQERSIFQPSLSVEGDMNPLTMIMSVPKLLHSIHNQSGRLHDICINACSDSHIYLLQPFEHVTISGCINCTIVIGAVAGLLHVVDCERTKITVAARRIIVSNCSDVLHFAFTPSKPLLVGDNRSCQFAPYNTYYDGLREDLLVTALAAVKIHSQDNDAASNTFSAPQMVLSKNMWKIPEDLTKLEISQVASQHTNVSSSSSTVSSNPGSDHGRNTSSDDMMQTPILLPPNEFHILYVPVSSSTMVEASPLRNGEGVNTVEDSNSNMEKGGESPYCRFLGDVLNLSPLRPPSEYERQVTAKVEKVRTLQQAMGSLTLEQQIALEDDLNRMFRDWLVTSGNLRQVLDLVHMIK